MLQVPLLNTYGIFTVLTPYTLTTKNYRCAQLELLSQYVVDEIDAYNLYYAPVGLSNNDYQIDLGLNATIVRLVDDNDIDYYIPNTYISSIPQTIGVPYYRMAISIDIAEVSQNVNFTTLLTNLEQLTQDAIGITPIVKLHKVSNNIYYSQEIADIKETQRQLIMQRTPSFYTAKIKLEAENTKLKEHITNLETAIIALTP